MDHLHQIREKCCVGTSPVSPCLAVADSPWAQRRSARSERAVVEPLINGSKRLKLPCLRHLSSGWLVNNYFVGGSPKILLFRIIVIPGSSHMFDHYFWLDPPFFSIFTGWISYFCGFDISAWPKVLEERLVAAILVNCVRTMSEKPGRPVAGLETNPKIYVFPWVLIHAYMISLFQFQDMSNRFDMICLICWLVERGWLVT